MIEDLLKGCFVVVDKPRGPPSAQVGSWVREILGVEKSGHIGTLDPNVSGVLIVALGKAIRLSKFLSGQDKEYVAVMRVHCDVDREKLKNVLTQFTGVIKQKPPLRSAVAKRVRERRINFINLLEMDGRNALIHVSCEGGTYIRKLIHDIGLRLGCGANMVELRRIKSGSVDEGQAHTLYELKDAVWMWREKGMGEKLQAMLIPPDKIIPLKKIIVKESVLPSIAYGSPIYRKGLAGKDEKVVRGDYVKVYSESGRFCGTARVEDGPELFAKIDVNWLDPKEFDKRWKKV